jgi:hypothetical protein
MNAERRTQNWEWRKNVRGFLLHSTFCVLRSAFTVPFADRDAPERDRRGRGTPADLSAVSENSRGCHAPATRAILSPL